MIVTDQGSGTFLLRLEGDEPGIIAWANATFGGNALQDELMRWLQGHRDARASGGVAVQLLKALPPTFITNAIKQLNLSPTDAARMQQAVTTLLS